MYHTGGTAELGFPRGSFCAGSVNEVLSLSLFSLSASSLSFVYQPRLHSCRNHFPPFAVLTWKTLFAALPDFKIIELALLGTPGLTV
jgi:hypothetical protein